MEKFWELQQSLEKHSKGDDVGLDLEYDGIFHPAGSGAGFVRERVVELRKKVDGVQSGETDVNDLSGYLGRLQKALEKAHDYMLELAARPNNEGRKPALEASAEAYEYATAGLQTMSAALNNDDLESLLHGQETFEAAVRELDALVAEERTNS
ncbi:MAG TPA: hypothetical protein VGO93_03905 [Candidatus Xenobia bacterium]